MAGISSQATVVYTLQAEDPHSEKKDKTSEAGREQKTVTNGDVPILKY